MTMKQTTRELLFMGRRALVTTTLEAGPAGPRTIERVWIDDATDASGGWAAGTKTIKRVTGSTARGTFRELFPERVVAEDSDRCPDCGSREVYADDDTEFVAVCGDCGWTEDEA